MLTTAKKFDYIDALRGIAILMVVLVHTSQHIENLSPSLSGVAAYCQLGVQLFFVASALTLCLSYKTSLDQNRNTQVLAFAIKRFFRIAPLYYLAIPLYIALYAVKDLFLTGELHVPVQYTTSAIASNVFFIHDFLPWAQNNIVPGGWSIGVEMAFYALFPILFSAFDRLNFKRDVLLFAIFALLLLNVGINYFLSITFDYSIANQSFAYYFLGNHLPVFLIGMLVYSIVRDGAGIENRSTVIGLATAIFIGFLLLTASVWVLDWPISFLLVPTLAGASFGGLAVLASQLHSFPKLLRQIGVLSYSIYILHFICTEALEPVLVRKWDAVLPTNPNFQVLVFFILNVAVAFAMAFIANKLIEAPGIALGRKLVARLSLGAGFRRECSHFRG